jgi:hypothetical protein
MKKKQPESQATKLYEFRTRLRSIPIKNLKKLVASYEDEISRLTEYYSVVQDVVSEREAKIEHG